jgi:hypothetical protein
MVKFKGIKLAVLFFGVLIVIAITSTLIGDRNWEEKTDDYINILNKANVKGVVKEKFTNYGSIYLVLKDESKYLIRHSRNYEYSPAWLNDFIQIGDSIEKPLNSDTLYIYRNLETYYFVVEKMINKDKY